MAPEFLGGVSEPSEAAFLPPADMFSLGQHLHCPCPCPCPFPCPRQYPDPHCVLGMVILRLLGHVDMEESELFRVNDRLRQNPAREVAVFFR